MRNLYLVSVLTAIFAFAGSALGNDCWNAREVSQTAHRLANATQHFHSIIDRASGYSHLSSDVHSLDNAARHLHNLADQSGDCRHLENDFRTVQNQFRHVSRQLARAHNTHHNDHIMHDWYNVEDAFYDVSSAIRGGHGGGGHGGGGHGGGGHGGGGIGGGRGPGR